MDDVIIVSGHNLGTAPIEDSINEHPAVAESAIVGFPHDIKGNALYGFVILKETGETRDRDNLRKEINMQITEQIGPIAKLDKIQFVPGCLKPEVARSCDASCERLHPVTLKTSEISVRF